MKANIESPKSSGSVSKKSPGRKPRKTVKVAKTSTTVNTSRRRASVKPQGALSDPKRKTTPSKFTSPALRNTKVHHDSSEVIDLCDEDPEGGGRLTDAEASSREYCARPNLHGDERNPINGSNDIAFATTQLPFGLNSERTRRPTQESPHFSMPNLAGYSASGSPTRFDPPHEGDLDSVNQCRACNRPFQNAPRVQKGYTVVCGSCVAQFRASSKYHAEMAQKEYFKMLKHRQMAHAYARVSMPPQISANYQVPQVSNHPPYKPFYIGTSPQVLAFEDGTAIFEMPTVIYGSPIPMQATFNTQVIPRESENVTAQQPIIKSVSEPPSAPAYAG